MQGGAWLQFAAVPMNLIGTTGKADYANTGNFAALAMKEAMKYGEIRLAASAEDENHTYIPPQQALKISPDAAYFHYCANNTIEGTAWKYVPETNGVPLACDMSSEILSRPVDVSKYGVIYAGVQKNMAPAGMAAVIIDKSLAGRQLPYTPTMMSYKTMIDTDSMHNTPPCYTIYMLGLVLKWVEKQGGVLGMEKIKTGKAKLLYDYLDESALFKGCALPDAQERHERDVQDGERGAGRPVLQGGGEGRLRQPQGAPESWAESAPSIYNAMPVEGVTEACRRIMKDFETKNK